jgi:pilus assembly protein CpaF
MFTIVISEKGGSERRETFEKNEINVGRVQGNDLMLPKGNVSKHHARLLYRDGRFIVTDLKSTNGTYVNGRKISQATIVREGDKIYIGDFVLRLETGLRASTSSAESAYAAEEDGPASSPASLRAVAAAAVPPARSLPPPVPPPLLASPPGAPAPVAAALPSSPRLSDPDVASPYPVDRESGEALSSPEAGASSPPKIPVGRAPQQTEPRPRGSSMVPGAERPSSPRRPSPPAPSGPAPRTPRSLASPPPAALRTPPRETPQQAARRLALITLIDRVADAVDLTPLEHSPVVSEVVSQAIERAVREQAKAMRDEGEAPDGIDLDLLARDATRELVGLGPLATLLDDDETSEIHVVRPDCVLAVKGGQTVLAEPSFTSEVALARIVARLAHESGDPLHPDELVVDRRLTRGAYVTAVAPPAASSWVLHIGKRRRIEASLTELVRAGAMSEAIATFLEACARARANVLVVGSGNRAIALLLGAIASAATPGERVAVLQLGADDIAVSQAHVMALALADHGARGERSVYAAARLGVDRLIITSLGGSVATATVDAIAEGSEGVLGGVGAPSLRHGLARLAAQVAMARSGSSIEAARSAVAESFDVAVEVDRGPTGVVRVRRVAELDGIDDKGVVCRDVFVLNADAESDPAYVVAGPSHFLGRASSG